MPIWDRFRKPKGPPAKADAANSSRPVLPEGAVRAMSLLGPDVAFRHGLAGPAVAGVFRGGTTDDLSPENFVPNAAFVEVVHRVIRQHAPTLPGFHESAREMGSGSIPIIDYRTPEGPNGRVPPEDIVGAFAVSGGRASADTYRPNPNYRVYTRNGLPRLPKPLNGLLLAELTRLTVEGA